LPNFVLPEKNQATERPMADLMHEAAGQFQQLRDQAVADQVRTSPEQRVSVVHAQLDDGPPEAQLPMEKMVADWFSARRGVKVLGEPRGREVEDTEADEAALKYIFSRAKDVPVETFHDVLGQVRLLSNVQVSTKDMTHFSLFLTYWQFARNWDSPDVAFTYRRAAKDLGIAYSGKFAKAMRESIRRLAAWAGEITEQVDDGENWQLVGFLAGAQGRELRNSVDGQVLVTLDKLVHKWMQEKRFSLVPLGPYLMLGSDLAKELYRFVETQRGFGANGDYAITVTPELLATLGCKDNAERRVRLKLRKACEEITEVDSRYVAAGLRRNAKKQYVLFFQRQTVVESQTLLPFGGPTEFVPPREVGARA
jgi:hypothetical protein